MKKAAVLIAALALHVSVAWGNPVLEISRSTAQADLKTSLELRYGSSYSTIEMLLTAGMKDYDGLCKIPETTVDNNILKDLMKRYYPSFSTIMMLYKANRESYDRLNK